MRLRVGGAPRAETGRHDIAFQRLNVGAPLETAISADAFGARTR